MRFDVIIEHFDLLGPDDSTAHYIDALQENGYRIINRITLKHCTRETQQKK